MKYKDNSTVLCTSCNKPRYMGITSKNDNELCCCSNQQIIPTKTLSMTKTILKDVTLDMEKLTKETAEQRVKDIFDSISDTEGVHCMEDALNEDFIEGLEQGLYTIDEAKEIASILRKVTKSGHDRWYA